MKRLPKKITNEIREILEGCRDGKLKHDQRSIHCGTSHCIAGWKAVLDTAKAKRKPEIIDCDFDRDWDCRVDVTDFCSGAGYRDNAWVYAVTAWRLNLEEGYVLFRSSATFSEQFALLEKMERGERVE
jgi:hypothetical protein